MPVVARIHCTYIAYFIPSGFQHWTWWLATLTCDILCVCAHVYECVCLCVCVTGQEEVRGLDIGCGANYIYCLLGASVYGWHMVGADITDVAITWANHNRENNRHLHSLLEVRRTSQPQATDTPAASAMSAGAPSDACDTAGGGGGAGDATAESGGGKAVAKRPPSPAHAAGPVGNALGHAQHAGQHAGHHAGQPGVGNEGDNGGCGEQPESDPGGVLTPAFNSPSEVFAFTMCNPPFFNSITVRRMHTNHTCSEHACMLHRHTCLPCHGACYDEAEPIPHVKCQSNSFVDCVRVPQ